MRFLNCFFLLGALSLFAQTGSVRGKILDFNTKEPLPYVNVILKHNKNTITGGVTNDNGDFVIKKIPLNSYKVFIQFMGYKTKEISVLLSKTSKNINLETIFLEENRTRLEGIRLVAEKSTIEQKIDRKVINIGKDLITTGASASDIMNNLPAVNINQDGQISLRGNENVRILIDGKPTNLNSRDVLQQIPTASIKTVELITNPSAKYNPEGMSGIINITLKKNLNLGLNGNLDLGFTYGERARYNNALQLNYNNKKLNIYGNYGNRFGDQITNGTVTRTLEQTNQLTKNINNQNSHLIKFGLDYFINSKNTFSFYTNQNTAKRQSDGTKSIRFFTNENENFIQIDDLNTNTFNTSYNFDYKHSFTKNHTIELELDINNIDNTIENNFNFSGNTPINNYSETTTDRRKNTLFNVDYYNAINQNSTLEMGFESRINNVDNNYINNRIDFKDSKFNFDRNIFSYYTTFSQEWKKIQYNIGVRLEYFKVENQFLEVGSVPLDFLDKQFNIYPAAFLKYKANKDAKSSYVLSYSRRVDRPSLNQINPIRQISTPQIIIKGNPRLLPQFTNSIELSYARSLNKGNLTFGGFYRRIHDEINRRGFFDNANPNVLILDYANFEDTNAYGVEFSLDYKFTNWWKLNGSLDAYSRKQKGVIENENVQVNNTLFNIKINQSFALTNALTFQLFTLYTGKQRVLQYELEDNYFVNLGARYSFANGKGSLNLNFNDIFKSQRFAFNAFRTIIQTGEFRRDSRSIFLGLSYRFGIKSKKAKRKKRDANEKADKFL